MHSQISLLAAKGLSAHLTATDMITRAGLDVIVLMILVGWLYRRRRSVTEIPLVLTALNLGLLAAMTAITAGKFPAGVGFGLFGILSMVRLRSAAFTLRDVAYTFVALVIGLASGLPQRQTWLIVALDVLLLIAVALVDDPSAHRPTRVVRVTLDRVYRDPAEIRLDVAARLGAPPLSVTVDEVDYVRETTRVSVRFPLQDPAEAEMPEEIDPDAPRSPRTAERQPA
ncbi:hypothetical protein GCM10022403_079770 [Streptomyces coacervatus]|uniref:DUF4956 domain-containing protein n=1 Tax=Streptomyces coacervatus TaxID=647381 RepID=A0ABP7J6J0_9ACTN|nr:DUF4956 domain-containing protein [Streptomyces coacervatus]MDF2269361.1 DUF4956 domain-containing protein [Streptomyces coacervatus]